MGCFGASDCGDQPSVIVRIRRLIFALLLLVVSSASARAGDWGRFRGPSGNGISDESGVPLEWSPEKNVKWRSPLPAPGNSSPIVSEDRVFVTVATDEGKQRSLYCFDRNDGRQHWVRTVEFNGEEPTHETNPYCGSSPAADGRRVVVCHSSAGLYCYDFDGNELWSRDLGKFVHIWGYGSSPVLHQGKVLLNCGPGERTFATALDAETGATLWKTDEPGGASGLKKQDPGDRRPPWIGSWSTPVVAMIDGREQVVIGMPHHVQGYDLETGDILWSCEGLGDLVYTDPLLSGGMGVAMSGFHGAAMGFRLVGQGNVTEQNRLWLTSDRNPQRIGSGVVVGDYVYMANESGIAQCLELATGKEVWKDRFSREKTWGSLVLAEGRLYVTNQAGDTIVFAPNPERFERLAVNALGEPSNSTPAVSDGQIFLRTFKAVYCIQEPEKRSHPSN